MVWAGRPRSEPRAGDRADTTTITHSCDDCIDGDFSRALTTFLDRLLTDHHKAATARALRGPRILSRVTAAFREQSKIDDAKPLRMPVSSTRQRTQGRTR